MERNLISVASLMRSMCLDSVEEDVADRQLDALPQVDTVPHYGIRVQEADTDVLMVSLEGDQAI
jgi:hypothetical protein